MPKEPDDLGKAATMATPTDGARSATEGVRIPRRAPDLTPGTVVGEYHIVGKLGEGGMGAVYAAKHPVIGKKAAVKVISQELCTDPEAVERFVQEARAVNQIGHPNIVDAFNFGTLEDGRCYFVMEWLQGESLGDRLRRGRMTLGEVLDVLEQICRGLEAAHEKGIIHRDLKPDNIWLVGVKDTGPIVKLLDFGLAKLTGEHEMQLQRTRSGVVMGTPLYISPEQARGRNVGTPTDIYALGVVAYEMVLGRAPFVADSAMDIISMHLHQPPPSPRNLWPEVPGAIEILLMSMLDKDPSQRPTSIKVRQRIGELRKMMLGSTDSSRAIMMAATMAPPVSEPPVAPRKRSMVPIIAGIGLAAVVIAVGMVAMRKQPDPTPPAPAPAVAPAPAPAPARGTLIVTVGNGRPKEIRVDDECVATNANDARIEVAAGSHHVFVPDPLGNHQQQVAVKAGEVVKVAFEMIQPAPPPPSPSPRPHVKKSPGKKPPPPPGVKPPDDDDAPVDPFKK